MIILRLILSLLLELGVAGRALSPAVIPDVGASQALGTCDVTSAQVGMSTIGLPSRSTERRGRQWATTGKTHGYGGGRVERDCPCPRFTGKERDAETGLDYFGARYFSGAPGRFTSPDPIVHPLQSQAGLEVFLGEPQRWNKYAYVSNNPLKYIDPDGAEQVVGCAGGHCTNNLTGRAIPRQSPSEMMRTAAIPIAGITAAAGGSWFAGSWIGRAMLGSALSRLRDAQDLATDVVGTLLGAEGPGMPPLGGNFARSLDAADLGIKGTLEELKGTFSLSERVATVTVEMIRGEIKNPFEIVGNVVESARRVGATKVRIQGVLANEKLYEILRRRYGLKTEDGTDYLEVPIQ